MSEYAIITGASKGLGRHVADECLARGVKTVEVARSLPIQILEDRITISGDFSCEDRAMLALGRTQLAIGRANLDKVTRVFVCAGKLLKGDFERQCGDDISDLINLNFVSPIMIAYWALNVFPAFIDPDRQAQLVFVASTTGLRARNDEAVYAATKHGVVGFARSLGLEMERKQNNTQVMLVLPGGMKTPFWDDYPKIDTTGFLDAEKVAKKIVEEAFSQDVPQKELLIERGSL